MIAYHGQQQIKDLYLGRVRAHRAADALIQATGWKDGKGCAIGCTLESYDHRRYPIELGIPLHLAHLEDQLFELQTHTDAQRWPERFLAAIRPGADLSQVWPQWAVWMLVDPEHGVIRRAKRDATRKAIERVAQLWREGGTPEEFKAARNQADDAVDVAFDDDDDDADDASASAAAFAADTDDDDYADDDYADDTEAAAAAAAPAAAVAPAARAAARTATVASADYGAWRKAQSQWAAIACDKLIALLKAT